MNKEKNTSCRVKVVGRDDKNRPILEFSGDEAECGSVLSVLAGKEEIYSLDEYFDLLKNSSRVFRSFGCGPVDL